MSCRHERWESLVRTLADRGHGVRESGAFLLGRQEGDRCELVDFVPYDDLEPDCLDTGIIRFSGDGYPALWSICRERELAVIADVHTHPGDPTQSGSDKAHPMMPSAGHLAIIVPDFGLGGPGPKDVSFNLYLGGHRWKQWNRGTAQRKLYVGVWA
jgi:hypothetical protein